MFLHSSLKNKLPSTIDLWLHVSLLVFGNLSVGYVTVLMITYDHESPYGD